MLLIDIATFAAILYSNFLCHWSLKNITVLSMYNCSNNLLYSTWMNMVLRTHLSVRILMCITTLRQKIHNRLTYVLVPGVLSKLPMMHSLFTFSFTIFLETIHLFFQQPFGVFPHVVEPRSAKVFFPKVWTSRFLVQYNRISWFIFPIYGSADCQSL